MHSFVYYVMTADLSKPNQLNVTHIKMRALNVGHMKSIGNVELISQKQFVVSKFFTSHFNTHFKKLKVKNTSHI